MNEGDEVKSHKHKSQKSWRSAVITMFTALFLFSYAQAQVPVDTSSIWQIQKVPFQQGLNGMSAMAVSADSATDVWVVGDGSLHFDGTTWTFVPIAPETGNPDLILNSVVALSPSNVWSVGTFQNSQNLSVEAVQHFDGNAWSNVPDVNLVGKQMNGQTVIAETLVSIAALSPNDLWAAGYLLTTSIGGGEITPFIERFNGTKWVLAGLPIGSGADILSGVHAIAPISDTDAWMVGYKDIVGDTSSGLAEIFHFDGHTWSLFNSPGARASALRSVAAVSSTDAWAVGDQDNITKTLIEHFDGKQWTIVPSPTPAGVMVVELWGVTAISSTDVWASGFQEGRNGINSPLVLHWDGKAWSVVPTPGQGTRSTTTFGITSVAPGDLWVAGTFLTGREPFEEPFVLFTDQGQ
jgi:hypothetical protein